jgi:hypothetical protein
MADVSPKERTFGSIPLYWVAAKHCIQHLDPACGSRNAHPFTGGIVANPDIIPIFGFCPDCR